MARRDWTPEEREEFRRDLARWEQERRDFEAMYERLKARWREQDERRERRRRRVRRVLTLGLR